MSRHKVRKNRRSKSSKASLEELSVPEVVIGAIYDSEQWAINASGSQNEPTSAGVPDVEVNNDSTSLTDYPERVGIAVLPRMDAFVDQPLMTAQLASTGEIVEVVATSCEPSGCANLDRVLAPAVLDVDLRLGGIGHWENPNALIAELISPDAEKRRSAAWICARYLPVEPSVPLLGLIRVSLASAEPEIREVRAILLPIVAGLCFSNDHLVRKAARSIFFEWQKSDAAIRVGLDELAASLAAATVDEPGNIRDVGHLVLLSSAKAGKVREELRSRSEDGELEVESHPLVRQLNQVTNQTPVEKLQNLLNQFEGLSFGSLKANQDVVNLINHASREIGFRFRCLQKGCDAPPALLRCRKIARFREGAFAFDHGTDVGPSTRFHGGYGRFPALELVQRTEPALRK